MTAITICSDFGAQKIKSVTVSTVSPPICHEVMGLDDMMLVLLNFIYIQKNQHFFSFVSGVAATIINVQNSFLLLLLSSSTTLGNN